MPRLILSPEGMTDKVLKDFHDNGVVHGIINAIPDPVINVLICLDSLEPGDRTLRQGADGHIGPKVDIRTPL